MKDAVIIAGRNTQAQADRICAHLGAARLPTASKVFPDGEVYFRILASVRGLDVFIVQTFYGSPEFSKNDSLVELFLMIDACQRASAAGISLICPYFPYTRQDRQSVSREPISAAALCHILRSLGVQRLLAVDLHTDQEAGFFQGPFDNLQAAPILAAWLEEERILPAADAVIVATDAGGAKRAERFARLYGLPLGVVLKRREEHSACETVVTVGDFAGKRCIVLDDMIDTGGSILNAARTLKERGAASVLVAATHALCTKDAVARLSASPDVERVVLTNSIPDIAAKIAAGAAGSKCAVVPIEPLLAEAIKIMEQAGSISALYESQRELIRSYRKALR